MNFDYINWSYYALFFANIGLWLIVATSLIDLVLISEKGKHIFKKIFPDSFGNENEINKLIRKDYKTNIRTLISIILCVILLIIFTILQII